VTSESEVRESVAATGWMISKAGLAEAFGHVSRRWREGFAITSVRPFEACGPDDVIVVEDLTNPPSGVRDAPIESPMHAAIYAVRPDVSAICRGHPPSIVEWGVGTDDLPLLHGLGAMAGAQVRVHDDIDLISDLERGTAVADTLADDSCVILRANGCLAVGADLLEAATRLYYLEERARVALASLPSSPAAGWEARWRHVAAELARAKAWMAATFGADG
jgi:HCOMODA/2-hydroxy-3-carboxy-muconic semialdehyde decarboxylase